MKLKEEGGMAWTTKQMRETVRTYLRHPAKGRRSREQSERFRAEVQRLWQRLVDEGARDLSLEAVQSAVNAVRSAELNRPGGASDALRELWRTRAEWLDSECSDTAMLPDFGSWLLQTAGPEARHNFVSVAITQLARIGADQFTLTLQQPHLGQLYALSIDFDRQRLFELAAAMPAELAEQLLSHFSRPFQAPSQVNLPVVIEAAIETVLGSMHSNENESYVPLVAKKIRSLAR